MTEEKLDVGNRLGSTKTSADVLALVSTRVGFLLVESWRIRFLSQNLYSFANVLRSRLVSLIPGYILAITEVVRVFLMDREAPGNKVKIAFPVLAVSVAMHLLRYLGSLPGVFFVGDIVLLFRRFRNKT